LNCTGNRLSLLDPVKMMVRNTSQFPPPQFERARGRFFSVLRVRRALYIHQSFSLASCIKTTTKNPQKTNTNLKLHASILS